MSKRGRKANAERPYVVNLHLQLYGSRHGALIEFLKSAPNRQRAAYAIRAMLGAKLECEPVADDDTEMDFSGMFQ